MCGCAVLCGAVWCNVVQRGAVWCSVVQRGAVWCSVVLFFFAFVAVRCSVLLWVAEWFNFSCLQR